jgi:hypothetical protein
MQKLLEAESSGLTPEQLRKKAGVICNGINNTQKRNEKARRSHKKTRHANLRKMGYDLSGYTDGTMLIKRL